MSGPSNSLARRQFASDNYAGICPEVWEAMAAANHGHECAYGEDVWTRKACDALRDFFETDCEVFFVFNGTAANALVTATLCQSYHSIICADTAHLETDECGAPEFFSNGTKVLHIPAPLGKVDLEQVEHTVKRRTDIHYPKPHAVSITQATERGTVYTADEVKAVGELAGRLNLRLHMDGARLANALATLEVPPKEVTWQGGVDVLCFGGCKNGMAFGEAVVFFNHELANEFDFRCKQAGQLASKMRFLAAPWISMVQNGAMLGHAAHANRCAQKLSEKLQTIPGVKIMYPCEANSVFVDMPEVVAEGLRDLGWHFYGFIGTGGNRFMCSWDTTEDDIDALVSDLKKAVASKAGGG